MSWTDPLSSLHRSLTGTVALDQARNEKFRDSLVRKKERTKKDERRRLRHLAVRQALKRGESSERTASAKALEQSRFGAREAKGEFRSGARDSRPDGTSDDSPRIEVVAEDDLAGDEGAESETPEENAAESARERTGTARAAETPAKRNEKGRAFGLSEGSVRVPQKNRSRPRPGRSTGLSRELGRSASLESTQATLDQRTADPRSDEISRDHEPQESEVERLNSQTVEEGPVSSKVRSVQDESKHSESSSQRSGTEAPVQLTEDLESDSSRPGEEAAGPEIEEPLATGSAIDSGHSEFAREHLVQGSMLSMPRPLRQQRAEQSNEEGARAPKPGGLEGSQESHLAVLGVDLGPRSTGHGGQVLEPTEPVSASFQSLDSETMNQLCRDCLVAIQARLSVNRPRVELAMDLGAMGIAHVLIEKRQILKKQRKLGIESRSTEGSITIEIRAESSMTEVALARRLPELERRLRQGGVDLRHLSVRNKEEGPHEDAPRRETEANPEDET